MRVWLSALLLSTAMTAAAETAYVTDEFKITLRTGQGARDKILKMVPSGEKLEVMERAEEHSLVRTEDGKEGWVLNRYLVASPIARDRLRRAEIRIATMKEEMKELTNQLNELKGTRHNLNKASKELEDIRRASANAIAIDEENKTLKSRLLEIQREMQQAQQEAASLRESDAKDWFLIGALVIGAGVILGLILPNIRLKKRSSWGSL